MALQDWTSNILKLAEACFSNANQYEDAQVSLHTRESKLAIPIIRHFLELKTEPDVAAAALAAICEERITANGDVSVPEGIWKVFCSAVDYFGGENETRDRLISLLVHLSKIEVLGSNGMPIESSMNHDTFWRQLPGFSLAFRDEMTCVPTIDSLNEDSQLEDWKRRFRNGNTFQAQWLSKVGKEGPSREFGSAINIALWHFRGALDPGVEDSDLGFRRTELWIPGVVQWIFIAGPDVFQLCKDNKLNDGSPALLRSYDEGVEGMEWSGNEGFSLERWAFWKSKFRKVAGLKGVKLNISQLADEAGNQMDEIEIRN